jgi:hypothetical protein
LVGSSQPPSGPPFADTCVFHVQGIDHPRRDSQFSQVKQPIYP